MENTQPDLEVQSDSIEETTEGDKTPEENEKEGNTLDDLPSEDDLDLEGEGAKEKKPETKKVERSEIAQKIKWREKAKSLEADVARLTDELNASKQRVVDKGGEIDEKEKAAQEYIRTQAKKVFEELRNLEKQEEDKAIQKFETELAGALKDNPTLTEEEILDLVEELEVDPSTAAKILLRQQEKPKQKPKMPAQKKATTGNPELKTKEEKKQPGERKGFWSIAQDVRKQVKNLKF